VRARLQVGPVGQGEEGSQAGRGERAGREERGEAGRIVAARTGLPGRGGARRVSRQTRAGRANELRS
jgi:hypothetical protein